jgi:dsRNA-specific ribonuclease
MAEENTNYKGTLLTKSQRENVALEYKLLETRSNGKQNIFIIEVWYNEILISKAQGFTKKDAEQEAARIAIEKLS